METDYIVRRRVVPGEDDEGHEYLTLDADWTTEIARAERWPREIAGLLQAGADAVADHAYRHPEVVRITDDGEIKVVESEVQSTLNRAVRWLHEHPAQVDADTIRRGVRMDGLKCPLVQAVQKALDGAGIDVQVSTHDSRQWMYIGRHQSLDRRDFRVWHNNLEGWLNRFHDAGEDVEPITVVFNGGVVAIREEAQA